MQKFFQRSSREALESLIQACFPGFAGEAGSSGQQNDDDVSSGRAARAGQQTLRRTLRHMCTHTYPLHMHARTLGPSAPTLARSHAHASTHKCSAHEKRLFDTSTPHCVRPTPHWTHTAYTHTGRPAHPRSHACTHLCPPGTCAHAWACRPPSTAGAEEQPPPRQQPAPSSSTQHAPLSHRISMSSLGSAANSQALPLQELAVLEDVNARCVYGLCMCSVCALEQEGVGGGWEALLLQELALLEGASVRVKVCARACVRASARGV